LLLTFVILYFFVPVTWHANIHREDGSYTLQDKTNTLFEIYGQTSNYTSYMIEWTKVVIAFVVILVVINILVDWVDKKLGR
jgi:flagellar biosynthesis protein FlhB